MGSRLRVERRGSHVVPSSSAAMGEREREDKLGFEGEKREGKESRKADLGGASLAVKGSASQFPTGFWCSPAGSSDSPLKVAKLLSLVGEALAFCSSSPESSAS